MGLDQPGGLPGSAPHGSEGGGPVRWGRLCETGDGYLPCPTVRLQHVGEPIVANDRFATVTDATGAFFNGIYGVQIEPPIVAASPELDLGGGATAAALGPSPTCQS